MKRYLVGCAAVWTFCVTAALAATSVVVEPPSFLLPNYDRVLVGSQGGLQAGALLCQAKAAEAAWYNPAGLVRCKADVISGTASAYELVTNNFTSGETTATSSGVNTLPSFIGKSTWKKEGPGGLGSFSTGFSIITPLSWNSDTSADNNFTDSDFLLTDVTSQAHANLSTLGVGYTLSWAYTEPYAVPGFTWGMSFYYYSTSLAIQESRFEDHQGATPDDIYTVTDDYEMSIKASHLGFTFGLFAKPKPKLELAFVTRVPGLVGLGASGSLNEYSLAIDNTVAGVAPFEYVEQDARVEDVEVEWKLPLEVSAGIAFKGEKNTLEFDINYHAGAGTYDVFPAFLYDLRQGDFGAIGETTPVRDALTTTSNPHVNIAIGYRHEFAPESESEPRFYAGFRTSKSPVSSEADGEDIFQEMDLYLLTLGFSKQTPNTFVSYGLVMGFGSADFILDDLATPGNRVPGSIKTRTIGLVLGASFKL